MLIVRLLIDITFAFILHKMYYGLMTEDLMLLWVNEYVRFPWQCLKLGLHLSFTQVLMLFFR